MSLLQTIFRKQPLELLRLPSRLVTQRRGKLTSEHLLKLRAGGKGKSPKSEVVFRTQNEIAMDNKCHMKFMPVPEGAWEDYHRTRNMKWSRMLYFSISFLGITVYVMYWTGCLYLHGRPSPRRIHPDYEKTGKVHLQ